MSKLQTSQAYRHSSFIPALQGAETEGSLEFQVSLVYTASSWATGPAQKKQNKTTPPNNTHSQNQNPRQTNKHPVN